MTASMLLMAVVAVAIFAAAGFLFETLAAAWRAFSHRLDAISSDWARVFGEAIGVAAAWPFEVALIQADRLTAAGTEWCEQRRIWRAEFRSAMSWAAFRSEMTNRAKRDELTEAASVLGLPNGFTKSDLDARFKHLMQAVHPDRGGSEDLARRVNDARALILKRKGWRR